GFPGFTRRRGCGLKDPNLRGTMESRGTRQVNEFKLVDDQGKEYTVFEYQEGTEKPSLKWIKLDRLGFA
ncbi:MAG: hypothetical protein WBW28_02840, partial [Pseudolabrys sp.]